MTNQKTRNTLLAKALTENAAFSAIAGAVMIAGAVLGLDAWLGVDAWLLFVLGVGLVIYAVDLLWVARSPKWLVPGGRAAVIADITWVVVAAALIGFTAVLTRQGEVALAIVSVVVAGFAAAQLVGLRKLDAAV